MPICEALQDWHLRYQLETVPGVAEVATIGGFVRQYQVQLDPNKLLAYGIPLSTVIDRVKSSTNEVGGRALELSGTRYMIRGLGYLHSLADLENVPVMAKNGTPVLIKDLGTVSFGPDIREGVAEWNGEGETVGGIVVMRYGLNALNVIDGVKKKLAEIKGSLPPGVEVVSGYDRAGLIRIRSTRCNATCWKKRSSFRVVIIVFLFHFRSALIPILTLPDRGRRSRSFRCTTWKSAPTSCRWAGSPWRLAFWWTPPLSWSKTAIAIFPNGRIRHSQERSLPPVPEDTPERRKPQGRTADSDRCAKQVGPALFFSLIIIVVSFLPVFLLEAQEGRMFRPLAWTKTLAVGFSSVLAITLVPVLMVMFIKGKLRPESENPISRFTQALYLAGSSAMPEIPQDDIVGESAVPRDYVPLDVEARQPVHAAALRRIVAIHADSAARYFHHEGFATSTGAGSHAPIIPRGRDCVRSHRTFR